MSPREPSSREIGPLQLLALGVNGVIGVGIFFAPAAVAADAPGLGAVAVFVATGLALLPAALTFARLGARFDENGGPVVFARAAFGEGAAFLVGWLTYLSALFSSSAVIVGLVRATWPMLGPSARALEPAGPLLVASLLAAVVAGGLRLSARLWTGLTVLKLLPLLLLVGVFSASWSRLPMPEASAPGAGWIRASLTIVFACQGFEIVPVVAGQARASARSVPMATIGSLLIPVCLYAALVLACVTALPTLASSVAPLAETGGALGGPPLQRLVAAGTSISALGIAFGMAVTTPHYLAALARSSRTGLGLEGLSARGVPLRALGVTWVAVSVLVSLGGLSELFALSSIAVLAQFGSSALALAVLAWRRQHGLRPAHAWPALPTLLIAVLLVAAGATMRELVVAGSATLFGAALLRLAIRRHGQPAGRPRD